MSLSKLAVELQINAIERLDNRTLNSLSLVSKHWRNVTEQYLYQDIKINQTLKLTYLLSTLFARKDLIRYVRKFSCKTNNPRPKVLLISVLPNRIHEIRTTITQATKSFPQHVSSYWHERVPILTSGDGSLALILCLATNLEKLDLNFEGDDMANYSMTSLVLKLDWKLACAKQDAPSPLQSLKSFNIVFGACYPISIDKISLIPKSAGIRQISIARLETSLRSYVYPDLSTMLHTFKFHNADVSVVQFSKFLRRQYFWNLKQLVVSQLSWSDPTDNNTGYLTKMIARHLPELIHLELSDIKNPFPSIPDKLLNLSDHEKIVTLIIDYKLIIRHSVKDDKFGWLTLHQSLPSNLRSLKLTNIKSWSSIGGFSTTHLNNLLQLYLKYAEDPMSSTCLTAALFNTKNLKELSLHVDLLNDYVTGRWAPLISSVEPVHGVRFGEFSRRGDILVSKFMRHLQKEGVELQVWRQECRYPRKLLYAPGYKLQQPIWSTVEVTEGI